MVFARKILVFAVLGAVSQGVFAQSSTLNNGQTSGNWNPLAGLFSTKNNLTQKKATQASQKLAQPMNLYPRTNKLNSYFADLPMLSNTTPIGRSSFPTRAQLPGKAYLEGFGYRVGGQR